MNVIVTHERHKLYKTSSFLERFFISHTPAGCVQTLLLTGKRGLTFTGETESGKKSYGKVPTLTDATPLSVS